MKVHFKLFIIFLIFLPLVQVYCMDEAENSLRMQLTSYHPLKTRALPKLDRALKNVFEKGDFRAFRELTRGQIFSVYNIYVKISIYQLFLHRLIDKRDINLVRRLLNFAIKDKILYKVVNAQYGKKSESPLHLAINNRDIPMVELLTQYYPNYRLEDSTGKRAFNAARWEYQKKSIDLAEWVKKNIISKNGHYVHIIDTQETFVDMLSGHRLSEYKKMEKEVSSLIQIMKIIKAEEEASSPSKEKKSSSSSKKDSCAQKFSNGSHD